MATLREIENEYKLAQAAKLESDSYKRKIAAVLVWRLIAENLLRPIIAEINNDWGLDIELVFDKSITEVVPDVSSLILAVFKLYDKNNAYNSATLRMLLKNSEYVYVRSPLLAFQTAIDNPETFRREFLNGCVKARFEGNHPLFQPAPPK